MITVERIIKTCRELTADEFHKTVCNRDVIPYPIGEWSNEYGYISHWKLCNGSIVGYTFGSQSAESPKRYFVTA